MTHYSTKTGTKTNFCYESSNSMDEVVGVREMVIFDE